MLAATDTPTRRIRTLLEGGRFEEALSAATALLVESPADRDALYMAAIAQRYLNRLHEALAILKRLELAHPEYPRLYQERGHCLWALQSVAAAIDAFEQAVRMSPTLVGSWQALQRLYEATGRTAAAAQAAAELASLAILPPEIVTAYGMYADDELADAERLIRRYLSAHGEQAEGLRLLAQIGMRMDAVEDAEILLARVVALAPDYDAARYDYATVLVKRHKHAEARAQLDRLLEKGPSEPRYRALLAAVYSGFGDHHRALPLYQALLAQTPGNPELLLSAAHAWKTVGRTAEAVQAYRAAATARPRFGEAYWSLANLKTYRFTAEEIARMREDEATPSVKRVDRYHLCFALGKALEDEGRYAESFAYYERGNALKKSEVAYRPEPLERNARLQMALCTPEFFAARRGAPARAPAPIFIVGLPRSGSTLLEQILASHSKVEGTMELADVPRLVQDLQRRKGKDSTPGYPAILAELEPGEFRRMGENYLAVTSLYRTGKPYFIDKMPNNFRHLGLIHLMLPNARFIDARRDALACCFSNFKQLFAAGQAFTYGIGDITRYYRMYVDLMAHWERVLPGKILRVQHENVVEDLEGNVRRLLDFCELEFEPACVEFHKTERRIHSASSEQVRQPINRDGVDQWRHFEPWLEPFKAALAAAPAL
jgi:tetratricopeptide (TPR) repeat protein